MQLCNWCVSNTESIHHLHHIVMHVMLKSHHDVVRDCNNTKKKTQPNAKEIYQGLS